MARYFDGADDRMELKGYVPFTNYPCTVACWFTEQNTSGAGTRTLIDFGHVAVPRQALDIADDNGNRVLRAHSATDSAEAEAIGATDVAGDALHHAAAVFAGPTDRRVFLDGNQDGSNITSIAWAGDINNQTIGARRQLGASQFHKGNIAEVAIWNINLNDGEIAALAAGASPLFVRPQSLVRYYPLIGRNDPESNVISWPYGKSVPADVLYGTTWAEHPPIFGRTRSAVSPPPLTAGYKVYLKVGSAPEPGVDTPVMRLRPGDTSAPLNVSELNLQANSAYHGLIAAFNASGESTGVDFRFETDGSGDPQFLPTPVTGLEVRPLPGGLFEVSWVYDETNPPALADDFEIAQINKLGFESSTFVTHQPHKRRYAERPAPASTGRLTIKVYSRRGGLKISEVVSTQVLLDGTPPAETTLVASIE